MRQIFSSPRLENVETLEQLLEDAGIATRVTNRATWNRATKRDFSYAEQKHEGRWPALWVVEADDYSRARELLREHGVALPTTRPASEPTWAPSAPDPEERPAAQHAARRARLVALVLAMAGAAVVALKLAGVV
jgi:hypothetical protein